MADETSLGGHGDDAEPIVRTEVAAGDGIDRRGFLKCMAWAGTGLVWSIAGGVPRSYALSDFLGHGAALPKADLNFVQISDSHIGFSKEANKDVVGTLQAAVAKISAQVLSYLKRFGSVTVLNGHIHQTMQKVEGNITFHTAMSTAFPQPQPGKAPSPGPMKVDLGILRSVLGVTAVSYMRGKRPLAVVNSTLAAVEGAGTREQTERQAGADNVQVRIDNFSFLPVAVTVPAGTKVTWVNHDDVPHTVVSTNGKFRSPALDTDDQFSFGFNTPGAYAYYCSVHPHMTAKVIVE